MKRLSKNYQYEIHLVSKWGNDSFGSMISHELKDCEDIQTEFSVVYQGSSGFTYVLVDESTKTRTCIHTPIQNDLTNIEINSFLISISDFNHVHFDSRHTEASYEIAKYIRDNNLDLTLSIDCEKDRPPFMLELIPFMNYIFTNSNFCSTFSKIKSIRSKYQRSYDSSISTEEEAFINNMLLLYEYLNWNPSFIVSTRGVQGAILIYLQSNHSSVDVCKVKELSQFLENVPLDLKQSTVQLFDGDDSFIVNILR